MHSAINKSYLWKECQVFKLHTYMRLLQNRLNNLEFASMMNFSEWILKIGNGEMGEGDGENSIIIPADLIIKHTENPMEDIVRSTYLDLQMKITDHSYL